MSENGGRSGVDGSPESAGVEPGLSGGGDAADGGRWVSARREAQCVVGGGQKWVEWNNVAAARKVRTNEGKNNADD